MHRIRALMDEVFGDDNFISVINFQTAPYATSNYLAAVVDSLLWYGKAKSIKFRPLFKSKTEVKSIDLYRHALSEDGESRVILSDSEIENGPADSSFRQY